MPPRDESKDEGKDSDEETKGGDDEPRELDPILIEFAKYCTDDAFAASVSAFVEERCGPFAGASLDDEQKLEWTSIYDEYVALVENRLEAFCKEHEIDDRTLFRKMRDLSGDETLEKDFVPAVVRNAEYAHFFSEMVRTADARESRADAADAADRHRGGDGNISGVWRYDSGRFDEAGTLEMLRVVRCPWAFRNIFLRAARTTKDVFITQSDRALAIKYSMAFFGQRHMSYPLDGEPLRRKNAFRAWRVVSATATASGVACESRDPDGNAPPTTHRFALGEDAQGREQLEWTHAAHGAVVRHFLYRA